VDVDGAALGAGFTRLGGATMQVLVWNVRGKPSSPTTIGKLPVSADVSFAPSVEEVDAAARPRG